MTAVVAAPEVPAEMVAACRRCEKPAVTRRFWEKLSAEVRGGLADQGYRRAQSGRTCVYCYRYLQRRDALEQVAEDVTPLPPTTVACSRCGTSTTSTTRMCTDCTEVCTDLGGIERWAS